MPLSYSDQLRAQIPEVLYGPDLCENLNQWLGDKPEYVTEARELMHDWLRDMTSTQFFTYTKSRI